jgi:hypothetical protein
VSAVFELLVNDESKTPSMIFKRARSENGRGERIRTSDPLVPNQVRYQTALRPELCAALGCR